MDEGGSGSPAALPHLNGLRSASVGLTPPVDAAVPRLRLLLRLLSTVWYLLLRRCLATRFLLLRRSFPPLVAAPSIRPLPGPYARRWPQLERASRGQTAYPSSQAVSLPLLLSLTLPPSPSIFPLSLSDSEGTAGRRRRRQIDEATFTITAIARRKSSYLSQTPPRRFSAGSVLVETFGKFKCGMD